MSVKGKFNKKAIKEEIKLLENKLKKIINENDVVRNKMKSEENQITKQIEILKNKLNPSNVYLMLLEETQAHKNELVFNCGPRVAILLEGIEYDGEDFYWKLFDFYSGFTLSSCVGRIDYIKGKIDDDTYNFLYNVFKINYKKVLSNQADITDKQIEEVEKIFK